MSAQTSNSASISGISTDPYTSHYRAPFIGRAEDRPTLTDVSAVVVPEAAAVAA